MTSLFVTKTAVWLALVGIKWLELKNIRRSWNVCINLSIDLTQATDING